VQRVIDLFRTAFPDRTDVRLKVKITSRSPMVQTHGDPRVEVVNTGLAPAALADWYRSLTCYVNASFGEGFGAAPAGSDGLRRAAHQHHVQRRRRGVRRGRGLRGRVQMIVAKNSIYSGMWADPDNDELIACMREVHADRATAARLGSAAARRAPAFSWEESIRQLTAALAKHGYLPAEFAAQERRTAA